MKSFGSGFRRLFGPAEPRRRRALTAAILLFISTILTGCRRETTNDADAASSPKRVVLYCSVDVPLARPVLDAFREKTGIEFDAVFDSEAGKTTGLANRISAESKSGRARADVFWSSEVFLTIQLARGGHFEPYSPAKAVDIPAQYKDAEHRWTGFALRARVLAYDTTKVEYTAAPTRWEELSEPRFAGDTAMANPLFGTTRGHAAAMFRLWGAERGRGFLQKMREGGAKIVDGNSAAVRAVMDGSATFAMTDTDDVWLAQKALPSLTAAYLDMGDGGTMLIPCSAALIRGGPNPEAGKALLEFLVSAATERLLAESEARFIPTRPGLRNELKIALPPASSVRYAAVADSMEESASAAREILIR